MKKQLFIVLVVSMVFCLPFAMAQGSEIYHLVNVKITSNQDVLNLQLLGFDLVEIHMDGSIDAVVLENELALLEGAGLTYEVKINDMAAQYEKRLVEEYPPGQRGFPDGSMSGYYTLGEIEDMLDAWAVQYPNLISPKQSIGTSIQGRDIWAVKISDNPNVNEAEPEISFNSLIHAREPQSMMTLVYYMIKLLEEYGTDPELTYLVDNREIWFIPVHNPDGYVYNEQTNPSGGGMWRKNRRNNGGGVYGVDLNRNYGFKWGYDNYGSSPDPSSTTYRGTAAFSEPESQAVSDFILSRPIVTSWDTHTYGNLYLCPFGYDNVLPYGQDWDIYQDYLDDISAENGYAAGPVIPTIGYPCNGCTLDWHYAVGVSFALSPEIGNSSDGFWPSFSRIVPLAEENQLALRCWTWMGGSNVLLEGHTLADDNGDGLFHPGEPVDVFVTLFNKGLGATVTNTIATISSASPYVEIVQGTHDFGSLASYTSANNSANPLRIKLKGSAPYGESITIDVAIDFDGYTLDQSMSLICGVPETFYSFDMESNPGWTAGVPGDTASTGIWERDDPIGTSSGGNSIQPEDDHTAAPGTMCYVTGNNSSSAGGDDVDDGKTTLESCVLDLNGLAGAEISFWRWYTTQGGTPDIFQIDISGNGGGSWVNVESLDHTVNSWKKVSFNVSDFITPTSDVMMRFIAEDDPNDSLTEACIDDFEVRTFESPISLSLSGPPAIGTTVDVIIDSPADAGLPFVMVASLSTYPGLPLAHSRLFPLSYDFLMQLSLNPFNGIFVDFSGLLDGSGYSAAPSFVIPNKTGNIGIELFFAAVTINAGSVQNISAPFSVVIQ